MSSNRFATFLDDEEVINVLEKDTENLSLVCDDDTGTAICTAADNSTVNQTSDEVASAKVSIVSVIDSMESLEVFRRLSEKQYLIAFDVEGVNLSRLGQMTVISVGLQIPNGVRVFLFDMIHENEALRLAQLALLKELFENKKIEKIIHDCRQDSDALFAQGDITLTNVFDTAVYVMKIAETERRTNLNNSLRLYNCIANENREEITDLYKNNPTFWSTRPLTPFMIDYASKDVASLFDLRLKLLEKVRSTYTKASRKLIQQASNDAAEEYRTMSLHTMVDVPRTHMGCIIGKGGSGITNIERKTGTRITNSVDTSFLVLANTPEQLEKARELIQHTCDKFDVYLKEKAEAAAAIAALTAAVVVAVEDSSAVATAVTAGVVAKEEEVVVDGAILDSDSTVVIEK